MNAVRARILLVLGVLILFTISGTILAHFLAPSASAEVNQHSVPNIVTTHRAADLTPVVLAVENSSRFIAATNGEDYTYVSYAWFGEVSSGSVSNNLTEVILYFDHYSPGTMPNTVTIGSQLQVFASPSGQIFSITNISNDAMLNNHYG